MATRIDSETSDAGMPPPARALHVDAAFERGGVWAGIEPVVALALTELRAAGEEAMVDRHRIPLYAVLRDRWGVLPAIPLTLTDSSVGLERTRNYPLDRAYRIVHGLVDLMNDWHRIVGGAKRWRLTAHAFDAAGHLAERFFREMARRSGGFDVVLLADQVGESAYPASLEAEARQSLLAHHLHGYDGISLADVGEEALADASLKAPTDAFESFYPLLLAEQRHRGLTIDAAATALRALCIYNHNGYYREAALFCDSVTASFDDLVGTDQTRRWNCVGNMFQALAMTERRHDAKTLIEHFAAPHLTEPALRAKMHYVLAMIHLRYSDHPDLALAEHHLEQALADIERAAPSLKLEDFCFFRVFIGNGIAFLRVRQGRADDALQLCHDGHAELMATLGEDRHRLHRSVLRYNAAQVLTMVGATDAAIEAYRDAIDIDPNYSEYYNELGNILQREGRLAEAVSCYHQADAVSAPYSEVLFNLSICRCRMDDWREAAILLDRAMLLDADKPEYHVLAAEIAEHDGRPGDVPALLRAALAINPDYVPALVNMATSLFEEGRLEEALRFVNRAIEQEPDEQVHRDNQAAIVEALNTDASVAMEERVTGPAA